MLGNFACCVFCHLIFFQNSYFFIFHICRFRSGLHVNGPGLDQNYFWSLSPDDKSHQQTNYNTIYGLPWWWFITVKSILYWLVLPLVSYFGARLWTIPNAWQWVWCVCLEFTNNMHDNDFSVYAWFYLAFKILTDNSRQCILLRGPYSDCLNFLNTCPIANRVLINWADHTFCQSMHLGVTSRYLKLNDTLPV